MFNKVLGIPFVEKSVSDLVTCALNNGGLATVPSGPGMAVDLRRSAEYRKALLESNLNIPDSGAMCLFWRLFKGKRIRRVSGLEFLIELFDRAEVKHHSYSFWVHPNEQQQTVNEVWLREEGFAIDEQGSHIAPMYPKSGICDESLLKKLMEQRPKLVILCIGGGVQERLGYWIREQYKQAELPCPAIICTGAAIGFLTGNQVHIPKWADRCYLGWLFRCLSAPKTFIPRYWSAMPLAYYIVRYGERLPPLKG